MPLGLVAQRSRRLFAQNNRQRGSSKWLRAHVPQALLPACFPNAARGCK